MNPKMFIMYYTTDILSNIIIIYIYSILNKEKFNWNLKNIVLLLLESLLIICNNYYNITLFRIPSSIILTAIFLKYYFNITFTKSIIFTSFTAIVSILVELFTSIFLINISDIKVFNNSTIKFAFSIINALIVMWIILNKKVRDKIFNILTKIETKLSVITYFFLTIALVNVFMLYRVANLKEKPILLMSIIMGGFILYSIKTIMNDNYNMKLLEDKNNNLKKAYKAYGKNVDDYRELKHNLKSDLYFLKTSIPNKYQSQINELIVKYDKNSEWINKIGEVPEGLQGIIFLKEEEAKRNNIQIMINSFNNPKTNLKNYLELCNTVNILLDNAIEASKIGNFKIIVINIEEIENKLTLTIMNEFKNLIDTDKIGTKNYSTKTYKSGLGINYIKNLNNDKISINFKIVNNLFITKIDYKLN